MKERIKELGDDFANKESREELKKLIRDFLQKKNTP